MLGEGEPGICGKTIPVEELYTSERRDFSAGGPPTLRRLRNLGYVERFKVSTVTPRAKMPDRHSKPCELSSNHPCNHVSSLARSQAPSKPSS